MKKKHKPNLKIQVTELEIQSALLSAQTIVLNVIQIYLRPSLIFSDFKNKKEKPSLDDNIHSFNFHAQKSDGDIPSCTPL